MKTLTIKLNKELSDAIQSRQLEVEGLKQLYAFTISQTTYEIPEVKTQKLLKQYLDKVAEYELLKQKVTAMIPAEMNVSNTSWNLNFSTYEVTFTEE